MQPSSLIFLVIIGIWAAYLLQHWVRRREHLATARSVDRFSDAMRVLERPSPLSRPDLPTSHNPRSYAVSPARSSRQEVVVKRAKPLELKVPEVPEVPNVPTRPAAAVRSTRVFHVLAGVSARRFRGLTLLTSLSLLVVVSLLATFSVLSWSIPLVALAVMVADVAWLRRVAASERAARRIRAMASRGGPAAAPSVAQPSAEPEPGSEPVAEPADSAAQYAELTAQYAELTAKNAELTAQNAELAEVAQPAAEVDPSGWAPVPVPPPTYTLKARAERPMSIPAFVELTEYAPVHPLNPDRPPYDEQLDLLLEDRRAAGA